VLFCTGLRKRGSVGLLEHSREINELKIQLVKKYRKQTAPARKKRKGQELTHVLRCLGIDRPFLLSSTFFEAAIGKVDLQD